MFNNNHGPDGSGHALFSTLYCLSFCAFLVKKIMQILLINPPNCGRSTPEERYGITSIKKIFRSEPLALEALAGNLLNHEVRIVDLKVEPEALEAAVRTFAPDLVGFTAVTCEAQTVLKMATTVKELSTAMVVVGGVHASCQPEFFNQPQIDFVVIGLGKLSLRELVEELEKGNNRPQIPGIAKTHPGANLHLIPRNYSNADLVDTVAPRYDLVDHYRPHYTLESLNIPLGLVSSAVGCPYDCHFCCISPITGGHYLTADISSVVRDINLLDQVPVIRLVDANSFGNPAAALKLAEAIAAACINKQYFADVRADLVVRQPDLIKRWREVGLRAVVIGFEEIDDQALRQMNKEAGADKNRQAIEILHRLGVTIVGDFIISPEYTEQQFDRLGAYVREQAIELPIYTVLTPLPGTALFRQMAPRITNHDLDYYTLTNAVVPTRLDEEIFYQRYAALLREGHDQAKL